MGPTRSLFACLALVLAACVSATAPEDGARRRNAELEEENAELQAEREALERRFGVVYGYVCQPLIEGLVLEVNTERQLVVIDKGAQDEVKVGFLFNVYSGKTYKGAVQITDVREEMSSGTILNEEHPIVRGDSATTDL